MNTEWSSLSVTTIYVREEDCYAAISSAIKEAKANKRNTNIIPQIMGYNPVSILADIASCPYYTIIIRESARK